MHVSGLVILLGPCTQCHDLHMPTSGEPLMCDEITFACNTCVLCLQ
jgi:hypothetical protein